MLVCPRLLAYYWWIRCFQHHWVGWWKIETDCSTAGLLGWLGASADAKWCTRAIAIKAWVRAKWSEQPPSIFSWDTLRCNYTWHWYTPTNNVLGAQRRYKPGKLPRGWISSSSLSFLNTRARTGQSWDLPKVSQAHICANCGEFCTTL